MNIVSTRILVLVIFFFGFSGKNLKICSRKILIFRGLTCDFFYVQSISIVKRRFSAFHCYRTAKSQR